MQLLHPNLVFFLALQRVFRLPAIQLPRLLSVFTFLLNELTQREGLLVLALHLLLPVQACCCAASNLLLGELLGRVAVLCCISMIAC